MGVQGASMRRVVEGDDEESKREHIRSRRDVVVHYKIWRGIVEIQLNGSGEPRVLIQGL